MSTKCLAPYLIYRIRVRTNKLCPECNYENNKYYLIYNLKHLKYYEP